MSLNRLVTAALAVATLTLAAPSNVADAIKRCATADMGKAPFPDAICHDITKPDGSHSVIFLSKHFNGIKFDDEQVPPPAHLAQLGFNCDTMNSLFSGKSANPDAPLSVDCKAVKDWLLQNAGNWKLTKEALREAEWAGLAAVDTCAFVLKSADAFTELAVDHVDIKDLLILSLDRHQIKDKLEVLGRTECIALAEGGGEVDVQVDWRIVRPEVICGVEAAAE